jgi:hypothetical protein
MIQIILLIAAFVSLFRRDKINALMIDQFPDVSLDKFGDWKSLELKSIRIFLWATWGLFLINMSIALLVSLIFPASRWGVNIRLFTVSISGGSGEFQVLQLLFFIAFIVLLFMAGRARIRAAKLKKRVGIKWPK